MEYFEEMVIKFFMNVWNNDLLSLQSLLHGKCCIRNFEQHHHCSKNSIFFSF